VRYRVPTLAFGSPRAGALLAGGVLRALGVHAHTATPAMVEDSAACAATASAPSDTVAIAVRTSCSRCPCEAVAARIWWPMRLSEIDARPTATADCTT